MGGATVTIRGKGLKSAASVTAVWFYPATLGVLESEENLAHPSRLPCAVTGVGADGESVQCTTTTPPLGHLANMTLAGSFMVTQNGIPAPSLLGVRTPAFTYSLPATPYIMGASVVAAAAAVGGSGVTPPTITVTGTDLSASLIILQLVDGHGSNSSTHHHCSSPTYVSPDGTSLTATLPPSLPSGTYTLSASSATGIAMVNASVSRNPTTGDISTTTSPTPTTVAYNLSSNGMSGYYDIIVTAIPQIVGLVNTSSLTGSVGSFGGGHTLYLAGWGFVPGATASSPTFSLTSGGNTILSYPALIDSLSPTLAVFRTPLCGVSVTSSSSTTPTFIPASITLTTTATTTQGKGATTALTLPSGTYTYSNALAFTPTLTFITYVGTGSSSPATSEVTVVTIRGAGFNSTMPPGTTLTVGGVTGCFWHSPPLAMPWGWGLRVSRAPPDSPCPSPSPLQPLALQGLVVVVVCKQWGMGGGYTPHHHRLWLLYHHYHHHLHLHHGRHFTHQYWHHQSDSVWRALPSVEL